MLFEMNFKVIEICGDCIITTYLRGRRKDVKRDIEMYKNNSRKYEMVGKEGMVVWR